MEAEAKPVDLSEYLSAVSEPEAELLRIFGPGEPLVIFDIGGCEGEDSIRYARRFPRARVFAFEPLPSNQAIARHNFERYGVGNAELVPVALSDRAGEAEFHVSSGRPKDLFFGDHWNYGNKSGSLLGPAAREPMFGWIEFKEKVTVACNTADAFCAARGIACVDFVHMDVQGAEHLVLAGFGPVLARTKAIWLEVSETRLYKDQKIRCEIERIMHGEGFVLAFESRRQGEGDQFYANIRYTRMVRCLLRNKLDRLARTARFRLGALRSRLLPHNGRSGDP